VAEHGVLPIEMGLGFMADVELRAAGVAAGVGHGEGTGLVLLGVDLAVDLIAGATGAGHATGTFTAVGATALGHEAGNHPVEGQAVVEAVMDTDAGVIELELFDADAPNTVANFVKLAKDGFYDGLAFHRVIPGFMAQGGCPNSREGARGMAGTGGPGYQINCEINSQKHQAGTLAMAHAGRNTGGSQFYICHEAQPHLDGQHTVFGHTGNMDVVLALKNGSRINKVTISD